MQYKIPIQIENEDTIVAGLSLRQIGIMMGWGGLAYILYKNLMGSLGQTPAIILASIPAIIGVFIALFKMSHMTFLPTLLNFMRLSLNSHTRIWSQGTDGFSELEIGYVTRPGDQKDMGTNISLESKMTDEATEKILKL